MMKHSWISVLILFQGLLIYAQDNPPATGEIVDAQIVIEKDFQVDFPILPKDPASPDQSIQQSQPIEVEFDQHDPELEWPRDVKVKSFVAPVSKPLSTGYQNYVKAGFGNYASPLLDARYGRRIGSSSINSSIFHESFNGGPVNSGNSASGYTRIALNGTSKIGALNIMPKLTYQNSTYREYGNTLRTGFPDQVQKMLWRSFGGSISIKGEHSKINYYIRPDFGTAAQQAAAGSDVNQERNLGVNAGLEMSVGKGTEAGFTLVGKTANYESGFSTTRSLFSVGPWIRMQKGDVKLKLELHVTQHQDVTTSGVGLFPNASVDWNFNKKWTAFALLNSGMDLSPLSAQIAQVVFLSDSLELRNQEKRFGLVAGIRGSLTNDLQLTSTVEFNSFNSIPFYIPKTETQFQISYDGGTTEVLSWSLEGAYATSIRSYFEADLQFISYYTETLDEAWHKPGVRWALRYTQNVYEQFAAGVEIMGAGGIQAPLGLDGESVKLSSYTDINLHMDYHLTERLAAFLKINNLLNTEYQNFIGYPVRGTTFKVGAKYRF